MAHPPGPALVLVAHGSRDPRFGTTAGRLADAVARELPGVTVALSYLDLTAPLVGDGLRSVSAHTDDIVVLPLLLGDGYHSRFDLPAIISDAHRRRPSLRVTQTPVLGDTSLVDALARRLDDAGVTRSHGVVMCAVGSSDTRSDDQARRRAMELTARIGAPVETVFATKLGRADVELRDAVDRLRARGADRIALSPYFLSPGLLIERVASRLLSRVPDAVVAAPLADHPSVIAAVTDRYRAALDSRAAGSRSGAGMPC